MSIMIRVCIFFIFPLLIASAVWAEEEETFTSSSSESGDESWMVGNSHGLSDMHRFSLFKAKFNRSYVSKEEEQFRFQIFRSNLKQAARNQELDPTAVHGITKFSDLMEDEFRKKFSGGLPGFELGIDTEPYLPTDYLPVEFDWRDHNAVTSVKNQGDCGACWSFSTIGVLEGANFIGTGNLVDLSAQQLLDCDRWNYGYRSVAFQYVKNAGGVMSEKDYPYTGRKGVCKFNSTKTKASIASFAYVPSDPDQFAARLLSNGLLSVALNLEKLQSYVKGVLCPSSCKTLGNHHVVLVGYGEATTTGEKSHWIAKNSWGANWGEKGYFKICRGVNACGIESNEAFTIPAPNPRKLNSLASEILRL